MLIKSILTVKFCAVKMEISLSESVEIWGSVDDLNAFTMGEDGFDCIFIPDGNEN